MTEIILYKPSVIKNGFFDDLSVFSWSQAGTGSFTLGQGFALHNGDGNATLTQYDVIKPAVKYRIKINIRNLSASQTCTVNLGGTATQTITSNNVYQFDLIAQGLNVTLGASSGANVVFSNIIITESPGDYVLDHIQDVSIPVTYSIDNLKDPATRSTNFSKTITIPGSKNNNKVFSQIFEISGDSIFNPNKETGCVVLSDGIETFRGILCLDNVNRINQAGLNNYDDITYDVTLIGSLSNLFSLWGNKTLQELDFSEYFHLYGQDAIKNSWVGTIIKDGSYEDNFTETYTSPTISALAPIVFDGQQRVLLTFSGSHSFTIGQEILIVSSNNLLSGFQSVVDVTSNSVTLNLFYSALTETSTPTGYATNFELQGFGYVYPMIESGTINNTTHEDDVIISEGQLILGKNYILRKYVTGDDFVPYGALSNEAGIQFICTSVTGGSWLNGSELAIADVTNWRVTDFYPALFIKEIIDKSFRLINYNYDSDLFNSQMFKRLIIPWSKGETFQLNQTEKRQLEARVSMQDTVGEPNGHTFETAYNLYPVPANHGDYAFDNVNLQPGLTPTQPFYWGTGGNPPYHPNVIYWTVDFQFSDGSISAPKPNGYPSAGSPYFDNQTAGGFGDNRNWFIEGCSYQVLTNPGNLADFSDVGGPAFSTGVFVSTKTGTCNSAWTNSATVEPISPFASHHAMPQVGGNVSTVSTTPVPFNHDVSDSVMPADNDDGNNWSTTLYEYEMPSSVYPAWGVDFRFSFSGVVSNYVKDKYAFNGTDGDMPSDYAGSGAPGLYATWNGFYAGGATNSMVSFDATEDVHGARFFNGLAIQKSVNSGGLWTTIKYLGTDGDLDPYSSTRFENTFVSGYVDVNLQAGDLIRIIGYSRLSIIALRNDGYPCRGASTGGSAGSGYSIVGGQGATGGPVKVTFKVDNAILKVQLTNPQIPEGFFYDPSIALPNIKISDFFKSLIQAFNLLINVDKSDSRLIHVETRDEFYSGSQTLDWTSKLDLSKPIVIKPMGDLNNREYVYKYKNESDYYSDLYNKNFGTSGRNYGDKILIVDNDFTTDKNTTELIFGSTPIVGRDIAYNNSDRLISTIFTQDNNGAVKKINALKLLSYNIRGTDNSWNLLTNDGTNTLGNVVNVRFNGTFKMYPQAIHLDNHLTPSYDLNFGIPLSLYYTAEIYTENNLFNLYHKNYIEEITNRHSKVVTAFFYLKPKDVLQLDFSSLILVDGNLLRLKKVYDYDVNSVGLTKCEFIKVKS